MLTQLNIRDFVIVDEAEIDFSPGFTVLTGETGAGKSILVDALGLLLGDRAESGIVRAGCDKTELSAVFDITALASVQGWLETRDLSAGEELVLRRIITSAGRSKAYLNGQPATLQQLAEIGELLADIHGQHEHQSLLRRESQRALLDAFGEHSDLLQDLRAVQAEYHLATERLATFRTAAADRESRLDFLRFQVGELEHLAAKPGEMAALDTEHRVLAHAGDLTDMGQAALGSLYEDEQSVVTQLGRVAAGLEKMARLDERAQACGQMVNEALIRAEEAAGLLRDLVGNLELDPGRLETVENRIGELRSAARKFHVESDELPGLLDGYRTELTGLEDVEFQMADLEKRVAAADAAYGKVASALSKARAKTARTLGEQVTRSMQELGMAGGRFEIEVEQDAESRSPLGQDRITFLVTANAGQPLQPLAKAASGGELSRISLAIQVNSARKTPVATLIYDEVDVGVGGGTAEVVGRLLRRLGAARQVLCITHLPQVAALGEHHIQVSKQQLRASTQATLTTLSEAARRDELARMLGGVEITPQTRAHAEELIERGRAG